MVLFIGDVYHQKFLASGEPSALILFSSIL